MDKKIFLITSYCDNDEKLNTLIETINDIKKYNIDICIHAHYPLPVDVQKSVNYYIFDISNPKSKIENRLMLYWRIMGNIKINVIQPDYGYSVIHQWKQSLNFLKNNGYDIIHIINYDTIVENSQVDTANDNINEYDGVFYLFESKPEEISFIFATLKINSFNFDDITLDDYDTIQTHPENYIYQKLIKHNILIFDEEIKHKDMTYVIDGDMTYNINNISNESIFLGSLNSTDSFAIYLYNIVETKNIKIYVNDFLYFEEDVVEDKLIIPNLSNNYVINSFGVYREDDESYGWENGIHNIKILINDEELDHKITKYICLSIIDTLE